MLRSTLTTIVFYALSICCFGQQYNVDFAQLNQVELLSEVEACNQEVALYVGWQPDAYGAENGRLIFGRYFIASGTIINSNVFPASGSLMLAARDIDVEATAIRDTPGGECTGYAIAVSLSRNGAPAATRLLILDASTNLISHTITSASLTVQGQVHGLFQDSSGDLIMCGSIWTAGQPSLPLVQKFSSVNGFLLDSRILTFDFDGDGTPDGFEARDILELNQSNTSAKYAVACRSTQNTYVIGLTDNLTPAGSYIYDVDGLRNPEVPIAMAEKDGFLFIAGEDMTSDRVTLVAVSSSETIGEALFTEKFTEVLEIQNSNFRVTDIVASPNEGVILAGYDFKGIFGTNTGFEAILVHVGQLGTIENVSSHNGAYNSAILNDIDRIPGTSGLISAGLSIDKNLPGSWSMKLLNVDRNCSEPCVEPAYVRATPVLSRPLSTRIGIGDTPNRTTREPLPLLAVNTVAISDCSRPQTCADTDPICRTDEINISTGYNEDLQQNIGVGQLDDDWVLTSSTSFPGSNFPLPTFVNAKWPFWHGTYPSDAGWINFSPVIPQPGRSDHVFQRCFCICQEDSVNFDFEVTVDDQLELNLIDEGGAFVDQLLEINSNGAVHKMWDVHTQSLLPAGKYCLEAKIRNEVGVMGFLASGFIRSPSLVADGCCAPIDTFLIAGVKFDDLNCNGEFDRDKGEEEPGVEGCVVTITNQNGTTVWTGTTDANGYFSASVPEGTYDVSIAPVAPAIIHVPLDGVETVYVGPGDENAYVIFGQKDPTDCNCLDASVSPFAVGQVSGDTCCYTFLLENDYGDFYDEVVLTASSGIFFAGNSGSDYNWTIENNGTAVSVTPELQPTLGGLIQVIVCLNDIESSSVITIDWEKDDEILCQEAEIVNCGCGISVTATQDSATADSCCTATVSIQNDFTQGLVSKVEFEIVDPSSSTTFFDEFNYNIAAGYDITNITNTSFMLESLDGGPIPGGDLQDIVSFCFGDTLQPSYQQFVGVTFLNQECLPIPDCTDTLEFNCTIIPDAACFTTTVGQGVCDSVDQQQQTLTFTIQNDSGEPIDKVVIYSFGNISFTEEFDLATPIAIGGTFTESVTISTAGVSLPYMFDWNIAIHNTSTNSAYCCQIEVPVTLQSCCEPCEDDWLIPSTNQSDSCCTDISILNTCDDELQKISARVLTSGAYFNNLLINASYTSDWTIGSNSGADYLEAQYTASDFAEAGNYDDLFSFCLRDTVGNPVELVEINYLTYSAFGAGRDSVLCTDTIEVQCAREPGCLALLRDSIYCSTNGEYFVDLTFRNTSYEPFTAEELWLSVNPGLSTGGLGILGGNNINSQTVIFAGVNLGPNQIFTQTVQITGSAIPGDIVTLDAVLHSQNSAGVEYVCCWEDEVVQLTLPDCCPDCQPTCCRDYNAFLIDVINYQGPNSSCDTAFAQAPRLDSCQFTTIDWGDGTTTTTQGAFAVQHMYSQIGTYTVCTRFSESLDGGLTSCWAQERCDTIVIDTCSSGSPVPLCDTLSEAMTQYFGWATVTCSAYDDFDDQNSYNGNDYVLGLIDIRNHEGAPVGSNWSPPMYHGPNNDWTGNTLGDIFGLALDPQGNIYTSFFGLYSRETQTASSQHFGSPGLNLNQKPTIYWINPVTGSIENVGEPLESCQTVGPEGIYLGFGNLAFNPVNQHLWVTNISNGKIYALDRDPASPTFGDAIYTFTPPLSPAFGTAPGRVFGLGYNHIEHSLYYSVWRENSSSQGGGTNEVYSVKLNPSGGIGGAAISEWQATDLSPSYPFSNPVLDISFSSDGSQMLLSERSIISEPGNKLASYSHESRHMRLTTADPNAASTNWVLDTSDPYRSEHTLGANSAGGGDFTYDSPKFDSCDAIVVLSEDIIKPTQSSNLLAYGIRGVDVEGGTIADNWFVDLDGVTDQSDKYEIGDVEVFRELCCMSRPVERCALNQVEWDTLVNAIQVEEWPNAMFRISNLLDRRNSRYIITPAQYWLTVDWGDGTVDTDIAGRDFPVDHIYASSGSFTITLEHELMGNDGVQCFETTRTIGVTDVEEADLSTAIQVMPNPFTSELRVSAIGLGANIEEVSLFNMTGQQVQAYKLGGEQDQHTLDTHGLPAGMYVVHVRLSNGRVATLQVVHLE